MRYKDVPILALCLTALATWTDAQAQEVRPSGPPLVGPLVNHGGGFWSDGTGKTFYWQPSGQISPGSEAPLPIQPLQHGLGSTADQSREALVPPSPALNADPLKQLKEPKLGHSALSEDPLYSRTAK